ncbi:MAG: tetratricopeptide repeat protein [Planctomycetes bacterium]|nr:tetratricopeptide repeat protein [Planctomycetota bacterium]
MDDAPLELRPLRRRAAAMLVAAGALLVVGGAGGARLHPACWALVLPGLGLLVAGARVRGAVALTLDAEGVRDAGGRLLARWADVVDADLEVRRAPPRGAYTERLSMRDGGEVALDVSALGLEPLGVHKAVRERLAAARDVTPPAATARERGREHLRAGRAADALAAFSEALTLDPDDAHSFHGRASAAIVLGDLERAEADLNEAIRRRPGHGAAFVDRAALRLRRGRAQLAVEDLGRALELRPDDPLAYLLRADAWEALGQPGRAAADRAAIKLPSSAPEA